MYSWNCAVAVSVFVHDDGDDGDDDGDDDDGDDGDADDGDVDDGGVVVTMMIKWRWW